MKQHNHLKWIVLGLCLVSFAQGAYELGEQSLWWDESLSHYRATQSFPFILSNQIYLKSGQSDVRTLDNHPPLYFVLLRLFALAAGDSEFALRFLSLAAGTLVVPLVYVCGRRLFGPLGGTLAATLGALSPLYLWYQQEARPYALLTFFATLSFYAMLRLLARSTPSKPAHRTLWSTVYVLSVIATLTTHYLGFFLLAAQVMILVLAWWRTRGRLVWLLVLIGIVAVAILLWGMQAIPQQAKLPGYEFIPWFTLLQDVFQQFTLGLYADRLAPFRWLAIGLLLASIACLFARRRYVPWTHTTYVLICFLLPILGTYALSVVRPAYMNVRHLIYASPFYYLLLGGGVGQAWHIRAWHIRAWHTHVQKPAILRSIRLGWVLGACLACVLAGMAWANLLHYTSPQHTKEDHREWGRYLSQHVRPQDMVIVNPGPISQLYLYYVDSEAPWFGLPFLGGDDRSTTAYLEQLPQQVDRVWVAYSSTPGWANPDNIPLAWLGEHATRTAFASFESHTTNVQVHGFLLNEPVLDTFPEQCSPLTLDLNDQLQLSCITSPAQTAAGDVMPLSLFWSAPHPLEQDYRVALSLVDDAGYSWAAQDYLPVAEDYPTSRWPAGRIVRDDIDLTVPPGTPPGRYQLSLSVYPDDRSGPALAVRDSATGDLQGVIVPIAQVQVVAPEKPGDIRRLLDKEIDVALKHAHRYGDIALLGHSGGGRTYYPGDVIRLDALWQAVRTPRHDLTLTLQLVGEDGKVHSIRSVTPAGDYLPTEWSKGEAVRGKYRLRIPVDASAGSYTVTLGADDGRLRLWSRNDPVLLGTIHVKALDGERSFEVPEMQVAVGASLNDEVELLGYDLESAAVQSGQVISCTLYWRAMQTMERNYTVFTHLVAPDGQTWGQWDNQPQAGHSPTTRWVPGQVIADPYRIPVSADTPPGPLELRVGMYDLQTMTRLPVYDENGTLIGDYVALKEIEVIGP